MGNTISSINSNAQYHSELIALARRELSMAEERCARRSQEIHREIAGLKRASNNLRVDESDTVYLYARGKGGKEQVIAVQKSDGSGILSSDLNDRALSPSQMRRYGRLAAIEASRNAGRAARERSSLTDKIEKLRAEMVSLEFELGKLRSTLFEFKREAMLPPEAVELFEPAPSIPPGRMLWRGTLARRIAAQILDSRHALIVALEKGFHPDGLDFTPHFDTALRYARGVNGSDPIGSAARKDAVIMGVPMTMAEHAVPSNEGQVGDVIISLQALFGSVVQIFKAV